MVSGMRTAARTQRARWRTRRAARATSGTLSCLEPDGCARTEKGSNGVRSRPVAATRRYVVLGVPREDVETGLGTEPVRDGFVHQREPLLLGLLEVHDHVADRIAILRLRIVRSSTLCLPQARSGPRLRRVTAGPPRDGAARIAPSSTVIPATMIASGHRRATVSAAAVPSTSSDVPTTARIPPGMRGHHRSV